MLVNVNVTGGRRHFTQNVILSKKREGKRMRVIVASICGHVCLFQMLPNMWIP